MTRYKRLTKKRNFFTAVIVAAVILAIAAVSLVIWEFNSHYIDYGETDFSDIIVEYGSGFEPREVNAFGKTALFNRGGTPLEVTSEGTVNAEVLGNYEIKYTVSYKNITETKIITVRVVDTEAPVITLVSDPEHYTRPTDSYEEEGYSAVDNYDGDITEKVEVSESRGVVSYTVEDTAGNKTTVTRKIVYNDKVPPVITLSDGDIRIAVGGVYTEPGYRAVDDCDGDITEKVEVSGEVDTKTAGKYVLEYTVADSFGNVGTAKRTVTVYSKSSGMQISEETPVSGDKTVYLTFDDGPGQYTAKLLDILDKYNAKATFFVTNQFPGYRDMIGEEARRGHTVAIHTYSHQYGDVYASEEAYFADLEKMAAICREQTGVSPKIIRFPGGTSNTVSRNISKGIMTRLAKAVGEKGYLYCDWNVSSGDTDGAKTSSEIAANVIGGIKNRKTSVVLQHDIHGISVDAVEEILAWGTANGYKFLAMNESSPMVHHGINN